MGNCPDCGEPVYPGEPHQCPNHGMMIKVSWETLKKIWRWMNGTEKTKGQKVKEES